MLKIMYPTWEESFNSLGEEQMRLFAGILDAKLDACNQKMNMLKGDVKGKTIAHESHNVDKPNTHYLTSNSNSYFNLMPNNMSLPQIYPPLMNITDKNPFGFWPLQFGQSSQSSSTLSSAQGSNQVESDEGRYPQSYPYKQVDANWTSQIDVNISYDPKTGTKKKNVAENDENLSPYYYNGNAMTMQSYPIGMHTLPFQNLPNLPPLGYQLNGFYDMDILQAHMFNNYMDG
ncbi:MADS-box transcription factor PHERES 2-like, partial [Trifolium medium]|nr:MADS-box transcription factor PHERES 2-like [Trifolium medium]